MAKGASLKKYIICMGSNIIFMCVCYILNPLGTTWNRTQHFDRGMRQRTIALTKHTNWKKCELGVYKPLLFFSSFSRCSSHATKLQYARESSYEYHKNYTPSHSIFIQLNMYSNIKNSFLQIIFLFLKKKRLITCWIVTTDSFLILNFISKPLLGRALNLRFSYCIALIILQTRRL